VFLACQGIPLTDITVELLAAEDVLFNEVDELEGRPGSGGVRPLRAGVALDIGTTTVSARLLDLDTFSPLDTYSALNDQRVFGADVMSRINAARNGKTAELYALINRETEKILSAFMKKYDLKKIEKLTVSGNTTMLHFFINADPSAMGEIPFTPVFLDQKELRGEELSLSAETVVLLPSIAAFIGSDIVSGLAALDILSAEDNSLLIDIGTNGEMALLHKGQLYCCSTAAGPAFEGAEISCGMGSIAGAINKVALREGKLYYTTIAGVPPRGICGCGLIDAMAVMLKTGIIDETGAFTDDDYENFPIAEGISIINRDVRQYQLAKSAILSGIKILCAKAGLETSEVARVYIAGGLGFFIDKENAVAPGLRPVEFLDKISVCGNMSLQGAIKCLADPRILSECEKIVEKSVNIELAADPAFMNEFAENMLFPEV
jgi:uncharacterized 2Fe-2S/4Fe-4S cluster protein (DUF4445 family)